MYIYLSLWNENLQTHFLFLKLLNMYAVQPIHPENNKSLKSPNYHDVRAHYECT